MWKWIVGVGVGLGILVCAGGAAGAGYYAWTGYAARTEAARVEAEAARVEAQAAAAAVQVEVGRTAALQEARAAVTAGDHTAAEAAFSTVLETDPTNVEALVGRGRSYAQLGRLELAETDLRAVTKAAPERPDAWESLAWVLARQGRDAEALDALNRLLASSPNDPKALRDRANARFRTGDAPGAMEDARQACRLGLQDGCALEEKIAAASRQ